MATINKFEDIESWQFARMLCDKINTSILCKLSSDNYALKNQIDRASGSIMDNIAEGFERGGTKEFIQFLSIAKASCGEVRSQLYRCFDRNIIDDKEFKNLVEQTEIITSKLGAFISYLKKSELKGVKFKTPNPEQ
jgi:four helix bundle protein